MHAVVDTNGLSARLTGVDTIESCFLSFPKSSHPNVGGPLCSRAGEIGNAGVGGKDTLLVIPTPLGVRSESKKSLLRLASGGLSMILGKAICPLNGFYMPCDLTGMSRVDGISHTDW